MTRNRLVLLLTSVFALAVVAGCGSSDDSPGDESPSETTKAAACSPDDLETFKDGVLTIATDSPAYAPYFEDDDPTNGRGFESALGYAIAGELGFNDSQVEWASVPFAASFRPGPKDFDFDLNQISITPEREKTVSFSVPYYTANQAVLVEQGSDLDGITGLDELEGAIIGAQADTTSLEAVEQQIQPETDPKAFENSNDLVSAFKQGEVDAMVVDLPTAISLRDTELPGTVVAGQFEQDGGDRWGALMTKDSSLKECVDQAIVGLRQEGTLREITEQWMSDSAQAPILS